MLGIVIWRIREVAVVASGIGYSVLFRYPDNSQRLRIDEPHGLKHPKYRLNAGMARWQADLEVGAGDTYGAEEVDDFATITLSQ